MYIEIELGKDIEYSDYIERLYKGEEVNIFEGIQANTYYLINNSNSRQKLLVKSNNKIVRPIPFTLSAFGMKPKKQDFNQLMYMDAILDPSIELITVIGKAGSGKTSVAIACALELLTSEKYENLVIFKSSQTDKIEDIGFLPGDKDEKLSQSFHQIERFLLKHLKPQQYDLMKKNETIQFQPMSQILGWSIENSIVILDEAQILNTDKIHQVLTRVGENSKLILTGDPKQQVNKQLLGHSGLEYVYENWNDPWHAKCNLLSSYRSKIAKKAADYEPDMFSENMYEYKARF